MGLWCRIRRHPQDPDTTVLMIDTEGLNAPHVEQSYNWALSTVVVLISSLFLYQTTASIDKAAIKRLELILSLATRVSSSSSDSDSSMVSSRPGFFG